MGWWKDLTSRLQATLSEALEDVAKAVAGNGTSTFDEWRTDRRTPEHASFIASEMTHRIVPLWRANLRAPIQFSPLVGYGLVFVGTDGNKLHAIDPRDGQMRWTYHADAPIRVGGAVQQLRDIAYPIVWFTAADGSITAVRADTGAELWRRAGDNQTFVSSVSYLVPRTIFYVSKEGASSKLHAVNGVDGSAIWNHVIGNVTTATPLVLHTPEHLIQALTQSGVVVRCLNANTGAEVWTLSSPTTGGTLVSGIYDSSYDHFFVSRGPRLVESFRTDGSGPLWSRNLPEAGDVLGFTLRRGATSAAGVVIATQRTATTALRRSNGDVLWSRTHGGNAYEPTNLRTTMPVAYGDLIFHIEDARRLVARNADTGDEMWNFTLDAPVIASPALSNRCVFVPTTAGTLYAFQACSRPA